MLGIIYVDLTGIYTFHTVCINSECFSVGAVTCKRETHALFSHSTCTICSKEIRSMPLEEWRDKKEGLWLSRRWLWRMLSSRTWRSMFRLLVTANAVPSFADSCHSDDGGDTFLRNVDSYKSHTESHPRRRHSFNKKESGIRHNDKSSVFQTSTRSNEEWNTNVGISSQRTSVASCSLCCS
jgi:hypothetical protein